MYRLFALVAWLLTVLSMANAQVTEQNAPAMMMELAKQNQAWNEKLNSAGVSIKLDEVGRSQAS
ncbi:MAG TPA: hypothetical protein VI386_04865 [Candidatus Sulfotelmatobacter sp.]